MLLELVASWQEKNLTSMPAEKGMWGWGLEQEALQQGYLQKTRDGDENFQYQHWLANRLVSMEKHQLYIRL